MKYKPIFVSAEYFKQGSIEDENVISRIKDIRITQSPNINTDNIIPFNKLNESNFTPIYVDVNLVKNDFIEIEKLKQSRDDFADGHFIAENELLKCGVIESEKMSKSKLNVVNPDDICNQYGADTLRLYEMFLGPLEQSKPWSTQGIEGVHRFLKKVWRLFYDAEGNLIVKQEVADKKELKALHKLIKKVGEDIEHFSFNTSVSSFMICVNELSDLKCNKQSILEQFLVCLHPYAPHITEELWKAIGHNQSITSTSFPEFNAEYLVEDSFSYPVSINGKHRTNIEFSLTATQADIEPVVLADETVQKWLEGNTPKKVIFVKGKIINVVV